MKGVAHLVHERTGATVYNFYIDMRTAYKAYDEFYQRLLEEGNLFVRGSYFFGGADFAEMLAAEPGLEPGDVLAIGPDGRQIAVTTLAFRHDRNFWVLADDGQVLWGRYLEPWAPALVAFVPQGKRFAVGLAYSRFTDPHPTVALFDGETDAPIYGSEDAWELAWMRYGSGDWRTGWMASPLADMLTATADGLAPATITLQTRAPRLRSSLP